MSLTSQIKSSTSPVRAFLLEGFPATGPAAAEINQRLRASPDAFIERVDGADPGLVGTAVGYVLQALWDPKGLGATSASRGAALLDRKYHPRHYPNCVRAPELCAMAVSQLAVPTLHEAPSRGCLEAALMLARLEQAYRVGPASKLGAGIADDLFRSGSDSLSDRVSVFASPATITDLGQVASAAISDLAWLQDSKDARFGPEFRHSKALGGADADIIADGQLLELKTSASARGGIADRLSLWQILGYVLADGDDAHEVRTVSLVALRARTRFSCPVQDYLNLLAGRATHPVEVWRERFAAMLSAPRCRRPIRIGRPEQAKPDS